MNKSIYNRIRDFVSPPLESDTATGALTDAEQATVIALLETLTADPAPPAARCLEHLASRTRNLPGYLQAYRDGLALLDRAAGGSFAALDLSQRDQVLRKILRRYPYRFNEPGWKRRFRVTGGHLDQIFSGTARKRFRNFVARDLLDFYFQGAEGWALVGYDEYPGHVRHDAEACEVVRIIDDEDGRVLLELSDATIEELDPAGLLADADFMLTVAVNAGRRRAGFSRSAYYQLVERVDMSGDRYLLRLGDEEFEIPTA